MANRQNAARIERVKREVIAAGHVEYTKCFYQSRISKADLRAIAATATVGVQVIDTCHAFRGNDAILGKRTTRTLPGFDLSKPQVKWSRGADPVQPKLAAYVGETTDTPTVIAAREALAHELAKIAAAKAARAKRDAERMAKVGTVKGY